MLHSIHSTTKLEAASGNCWHCWYLQPPSMKAVDEFLMLAQSRAIGVIGSSKEKTGEFFHAEVPELFQKKVIQDLKLGHSPFSRF